MKTVRTVAEMRERALRREDPRLLTGGGRYVDDIQLPGMLHLAFVRSGVPHGRIRAVDLEAARALDGVELALVAADLPGIGVGPVHVGSRLPDQRNLYNPALADGKVFYVGQPIVAILARDRYIAEDAAALVRLDIQPLPAVTDAVAALEEDSPLLYEEWGTNVAARGLIGRGGGDEAFESADVVLHERFRVHRHAGMSLEPRGAVATHDPVLGRTTAWISTQSTHHVRTATAKILSCPESELRIIAPDVGGAFGTKEFPMPEEVIVCALARTTGAPVKWFSDANEHFLSTVHAREKTFDLELAADATGRIKAVRGRVVLDAGGHLGANGIAPALQAASMMLGPYDVQDYRMEVLGVMTHKVPSGAFRGFGVPEAAFALERLVDELSRRLELDPAEVRRRNFISPDAQPYATAGGRVYDSGDYAAALDRALQVVGYDEFEQLREQARAEGRLIGIGLASFVMCSGLAPSRVLATRGASFGSYSSSLVRFDPTGRVTVFSGSSSQGQGTGNMFAQLAADHLGLESERHVDVVLGDTDMTPYDPAGSISARTTPIAGGAVVMAAEELREKLIAIAAHRLEAAEGDIELADGRAHVRGAPSKAVTIAELARIAHLGHDLPDGVLPGLEARSTHEPANTTYPFGSHAVVVEVTPETGQVKILRYVAVQDSGTIIDRRLSLGQIHGAVVQGIAGALFEHLAYGPDGQPLAASYMDYLMPTAADLPELEVELMETASPHIPGGMKGVSEAPIVGPAAAIANAVADALAPLGVPLNELPLHPDRVRELADASRIPSQEES
jgi:carbon-monoxide dehydrogenase large subunit